MKTRTITATKLRDNLAGILADTSQDTIYIITNQGKAERAIVNLDKLEDILAASEPTYLEEIAKAKRQAAAGEVLDMDEVFGNL